jgi:acyl-CoA thioesterase
MEEILKLFDNDRFAKLLGIKILNIEQGYACCSMLVTNELLNGKDIIQGGALFTLCDFTMAIAANSRGQISYTINSSITYLKGTFAGETLIAKSVELSCGNKIANYRIEVFNTKDEMVTVFNGTCNRTSEKIHIQLAEKE